MERLVPRIVLCVPGPWSDTKALGAALRATELEWQLHEGVLQTSDGRKAALDLRPPDARLERAFRAARARRSRSLRDAELAAIADHASCAYAIGPGANAEQAGAVAAGALSYGAALVSAGGLAVKCDSSGIAHPGVSWMELFLDADDARTRMAQGDENAALDYWGALFSAFVQLPISDEGDLYSCGMHLLGMPDAIVARAEVESDLEAARLLDGFLMYARAEAGPGAFADGHTFALEASGPRWSLRAERCTRYPADDLFHNPYGYLRLSRLRS